MTAVHIQVLFTVPVEAPEDQAVVPAAVPVAIVAAIQTDQTLITSMRSEERRVGKE